MNVRRTAWMRRRRVGPILPTRSLGSVGAGQDQTPPVQCDWCIQRLRRRAPWKGCPKLEIHGEIPFHTFSTQTVSKIAHTHLKLIISYTLLGKHAAEFYVSRRFCILGYIVIIQGGLQNTLEKIKFSNMLSELNYIYGTISCRCVWAVLETGCALNILNGFSPRIPNLGNSSFSWCSYLPLVLSLSRARILEWRR
jgi:hypothetical protein